jgi:predicted SAM-dependent methyltransferase
MKLNLGCESVGIVGYLGVDMNGPDLAEAVNVQADVMHLPFADGSVEEIYASHVLEHLSWDQDPMAEWAACLSPAAC